MENNEISNGVSQEKPTGVENIWDIKIHERISEVLELIERDKNYNTEDIDEEEITSALVGQFNNLPEDAVSKESFLTTIEQKIRTIIIKKKEARIGEGFSKTMEEIRKIEKRAHGIDGNISKISKAA
ncbi:MAG: hypothetical protein WC619_04645 [Patescibacteria group bacterium]